MAVCLAKLSDREGGVLVREVTKKPVVTLTELRRSCVEMWKLPGGPPSLQHSTDLGFMAESPGGNLSSAKDT